MIDQASVFAERYKSNPQILQATVLGQGGDPHLDPYTALRALQLIKESNQMAMARQAQQPTSAPSILSDAMTPVRPPMMPMGAPVAQGQPPQPPQAPQAPQAPVMQASGGLAAMHVPEEHYAAGGILAFSGDDRGDDPFGQFINTDAQDDTSTTNDQGQGSQSAFDSLNAYILDYLKNKPASAPPPTAQELSAIRAKFLKEQEDYAGPNIYAPAQADQTAREEARKTNMGQLSGLALLQAAGAVLKGHSLGEGVSNAAPAYANAMGEAIRADQAEKRAIEQMNFNLADAQRKERMGNFRAANESMENYRKSIADAQKAKAESDRADALLAGRAAAANRPLRSGAGAASGPKLAEQLAAAEIAYEKDPSKENLQTVRGLRAAANQMRSMTSTVTSEFGATRGGVNLAATATPVQEKVDAAVAAAMKTFKLLNRDYNKAIRNKDMAEAQRLYNAEEAQQRALHAKTEAMTQNPTPVPIPNPRGNLSAPRPRIAPPPGFVPD